MRSSCRSHWKTALLKSTSVPASGSYVWRSPRTKSMLGNATRALDSMSGEESLPESWALGKRAARDGSGNCPVRSPNRRCWLRRLDRQLRYELVDGARAFVAKFEVLRSRPVRWLSMVGADA